MTGSGRVVGGVEEGFGRGLGGILEGALWVLGGVGIDFGLFFDGFCVFRRGIRCIFYEVCL